MASKGLTNLFTRLRALAALHQAEEFPDQELLKRFIQRHDEAAFTALVERHGAMVLTVCRRVLRHHQDAEDACQAVFLVLVRKASSIRKLNSLSSWLHGVALRVAKKLRTRRARLPRTVGELPAAPDEKAGCTWSELGAVLDEELQRLPEKYRAPLVLCYLQARTRDEAAQELGWRPATLKGRLELGRKMLHRRLARRGLTLSATLLVAGLGGAASASVPSTVAVAIVKASLEIATGKALSAGGLSPQIIWLVQDFLRTTLVTQLQVGAGIFLLLLGLASAGWVASRTLTHKPGADSLAERHAPEPQAGNVPQAEPVPELVPLPRVQTPLPADDQPASLKELVPLQQEEPRVNLIVRCGECHALRHGREESERDRRKLPGRKREREKDDDLLERIGRWSDDRMLAFLTKPGKDDRIAAHRLTVEDARAVVAALHSLPPKRKGSGRRDD